MTAQETHQLWIGRDLIGYWSRCPRSLRDVYLRQFKTGNWVSRRFVCCSIAEDIWQSLWPKCNLRVQELLISSTHIFLLAETNLTERN
jgi:hypothetical protein